MAEVTTASVRMSRASHSPSLDDSHFGGVHSGASELGRVSPQALSRPEQAVLAW